MMALFGASPPAPQKPPEKPQEPAGDEEMPVGDRKLLEWREKQLRDGGFLPEAAVVLAAERDVDYRRACDLLKASQDLEWTLDQLL